MAIKTTGAEWKRFLADEAYWGDFCVEEEVISVNGNCLPLDHGTNPKTVQDGDAVAIHEGVVCSQEYEEGHPKEMHDLAQFFRAWRKKQTHVSFTVECKRDVADFIKTAVVARGGKVL